MRIARRTPTPRHLAGQRRPVDDTADFDVDAALTDPHFDFDALFVEDETTDDAPPARVARHRIAFAVSVTLAALPLLVLDNLPATAGTEGRAAVDSTESVEAAPESTAAQHQRELDELRAGRPSPITVAPATVFIEDPTTTTAAPTTTEAPTTTAAPTTTEAPTTTAAPTTTTPPPPPTTEPAATASAGPDPRDPATWDRLAKCESGGDWAANTGNGYYGGLQFSLPTWRDMGGTGYPHEHSRETQIEMGQRLHARSGWSAWPGCSRKLGWS